MSDADERKLAELHDIIAFLRRILDERTADRDALRAALQKAKWVLLWVKVSLEGFRR